MVTFVYHIYIYLAYMASFAKKKFYAINCGRWNIWRQKSYTLCLVMFFKCDFKVVNNLETKSIALSIWKKTCKDFFLITYTFCYHIWNTLQGIICSTFKIFAYVPLSALNGDQLKTFDRYFCWWRTFRIGKTIIYSWSKIPSSLNY